MVLRRSWWSFEVLKSVVIFKCSWDRILLRNSPSTQMAVGTSLCCLHHGRDYLGSLLFIQWLLSFVSQCCCTLMCLYKALNSLTRASSDEVFCCPFTSFLNQSHRCRLRHFTFVVYSGDCIACFEQVSCLLLFTEPGKEPLWAMLSVQLHFVQSVTQDFVAFPISHKRKGTKPKCMSHYLLNGSYAHIFIVPQSEHLLFCRDSSWGFVLLCFGFFPLVNIRVNVQLSPFAVLSTRKYNAAPASTPWF